MLQDLHPYGPLTSKPYSADYQYDIIERYRHGEMTSADCINVMFRLNIHTKREIVYGGGGITPDIFVPCTTD